MEESMLTEIVQHSETEVKGKERELEIPHLLFLGLFFGDLALFSEKRLLLQQRSFDG